MRDGRAVAKGRSGNPDDGQRVCRDHGYRVALLRPASSGAAGYVTSRPRSRIGTLCMFQPLEIRSTPVAAMIGAVSRLIRPEASVMARARPSISPSSPRSASIRPATGPCGQVDAAFPRRLRADRPRRRPRRHSGPVLGDLHPRTLHQGPPPRLAPRPVPRPQGLHEGQPPLGFPIQLRPQALRPSSSAA